MHTTLTGQNTKPVFIAARLPSQTRIDRAIEVLAIIGWMHGTAAAFKFYRDYIEHDRAVNIAVSHEVEARAFAGTRWA